MPEIGERRAKVVVKPFVDPDKAIPKNLTIVTRSR